MRAKKILLRWLLPAVLAAAMLLAGSFVPNLLLRRQAERLRQGASAVPVEDVRPYGDDYDNMKNALLGAVRLVETYESQGLEYDYVAPDTAGVEEAFAGFMDFQLQLLDTLSQQGYWLDSLYGMEYGYYEALRGSGSDWVLRTEGDEPYSGEHSVFLVQPEYSVPVRASVFLTPTEYFSPQALWDCLLETYRAYCGLSFTGTQVETNLSAGGSEALDEEAFREGWLEAETVTGASDGAMASNSALFCGFEAVSSDLTFRIQLDVTVWDGGSWNLELRLLENPEG